MDDRGPSSDQQAFKIRATVPDWERHPDLKQIASALLRAGPRSKTEMVCLAIRDRNTGEFHSHKVALRTHEKDKDGNWKKDLKKSITFNSPDEIQKFLAFIAVSCGGSVPSSSGEYLLVPISNVSDTAALQRVITAVTTEGKAHILTNLLQHAARTPDLINALMQQAARNPELFIEAAATLNLARYRQAVTELKTLIDTPAREHAFQLLLTDSPWMFGSEYSALLPQRNWTRGAEQDFVLRRTTDGYIEVIEIKTPLNGKLLFGYDQSHDSYYARAELSCAIGQVQKYIEELDTSRNEIFRRDREDTNKIRAKVIIGRDGDDDQRQALRRFNGHMHRIEVLTFDGLVRIAERVVGYLEELVPGDQSTGEEVSL